VTKEHQSVHAQWRRLLIVSSCNISNHVILEDAHYLSLDLDLENGADDGQDVADYDEDVPAVQKLQLVGPRDSITTFFLAVDRVLLFTTQLRTGTVYIWKEVHYSISSSGGESTLFIYYIYI